MGSTPKPYENYENPRLAIQASDVEDFRCESRAFPKGSTPYVEWLMDKVAELAKGKVAKVRYERWVKKNRKQRRVTQLVWWESKSL